jgi:hypothetical protein
MHELVVAAASSLKLPAIRLQELDQLTTLDRVYYTHYATVTKLATFSCATVPIFSGSGPAKWLKNKNL